MAASKTPTRKSAPNKVPALVMRLMAVLRADITFLPNHDTHCGQKNFMKSVGISGVTTGREDRSGVTRRSWRRTESASFLEHHISTHAESCWLKLSRGDDSLVVHRAQRMTIQG